MGYSPCGRKESDRTEHFHFTQHLTVLLDDPNHKMITYYLPFIQYYSSPDISLIPSVE